MEYLDIEVTVAGVPIHVRGPKDRVFEQLDAILERYGSRFGSLLNSSPRQQVDHSAHAQIVELPNSTDANRDRQIASPDQLQGMIAGSSFTQAEQAVLILAATTSSESAGVRPVHINAMLRKFRLPAMSNPGQVIYELVDSGFVEKIQVRGSYPRYKLSTKGLKRAEELARGRIS